MADVATFLRSHTDQMVAALSRLVASESPSDDPAALWATATVVASLGTDLLGTSPDLLDADRTPVLRWRLPATEGATGAPILLLAHLDTVWPRGTVDRWPFRVADGRATGPGAFDMKAGLVQGLFALHALTLSGRRMPPLILLVTSDEEIGSPAGRAVVEQEAGRVGAALVLEPSADGRLKTERKGVGIYRLQVAGRAAHAGLEPERGVNALTEAALLIGSLPDIADADAGTTVTPTLAQAGTTQNTVPAAASVTLDVRARSALEQARVDTTLRELRVGTDATLEILGGTNRPPMEATASADLFALARELSMACGIDDDLQGVAVGGGSDGNFTAALGVPTLDGLGAVGAGAHAEGEYVLIDEMPSRAHLVAELLSALADGPVDTYRGER